MRRSPRGRLPAIATLALCCWAALAQAEIRIDVEGVDAELKANILKTLSIARYTDRSRIEADSVDRLFRRVEDEVADALRPYGYYHPVIRPALETLDRVNSWRVRIEVEPGAPMLIADVSITIRGAGASDPLVQRLTGAVPLIKGERLRHQVYDSYKRQLEAVTLTYGYLDARWVRSQLLTDAATNQARVVLELETGERYRFGKTTIDQSAIRADRMQRFLQYRENEPYDDSKRLRTQFALDDSLYFSSVNVSPGQRDESSLLVPIDISTVAARQSYSFAFGYVSARGTRGVDASGVRGSVSWLNPRVNTLGHRLQVRLQGSQNEQAFDARYDVPFGDLAREKMSVNFTAAKRVLDTVRTDELSLTPSITQVLGHWQRVLSVAATHTTTLDNVSGRQVDDLIVPGITYASVPEGYLGENLLSRTLFIELLGSHKVLGAKGNFLRLDIQSERLFDLKPRWHVLLRAELGATNVGETTDVPGQYRFFAGGDRSVRGFANAELSPLRAIPGTGGVERVGGRHLVTGTVELQRDLPRSLALAGFFDFGNAVDYFGDPLAYSVGAGLRWRLPGLTLGLDVGQALRAPGYDKLPGPRLHLNISQTL